MKANGGVPVELNVVDGFPGQGRGASLGAILGGPEAESKLKQNPRIAKYFEDPQFYQMWQACSQNPQMLMQVIQTDPRFMDVFKELTGIDFNEVQENV
jgi:hypothetical protein